MTRRPLLTLALIAIAIFAALNLGMRAVNRRLPYRMKLESIRTAKLPNVVFVGNSLLDHRVDADAFASAAASNGVSYTPLDAALGASLGPEHELLFRYSIQVHPEISTLVIGFFDFQLTSPDPSHVDDLKGNRMVGIDHRFPLQEVDAAYGFGARDRAQLLVVRALPMMANRANAWKYVELMRRSMASVGMPRVASNSMGRVEDFAALEAGSPQRFDEQAQDFLRDPSRLNHSYESILAEAAKAHMKIVLVAMPMSPSHRTTYYSRPLWGQYLQAVENLAASREVQLIDASTWLGSDEDFVDHLHMTHPAATQFCSRLADELTKHPAMQHLAAKQRAHA